MAEEEDENFNAGDTYDTREPDRSPAWFTKGQNRYINPGQGATAAIPPLPPPRALGNEESIDELNRRIESLESMVRQMLPHLFPKDSDAATLEVDSDGSPIVGTASILDILSQHGGDSREDFQVSDAGANRATVEWNGNIVGTNHGGSESGTDQVRRIFFSDPGVLGSAPTGYTNYPIYFDGTSAPDDNKYTIGAQVQIPNGGGGGSTITVAKNGSSIVGAASTINIASVHNSREDFGVTDAGGGQADIEWKGIKVREYLAGTVENRRRLFFDGPHTSPGAGLTQRFCYFDLSDNGNDEAKITASVYVDEQKGIEVDRDAVSICNPATKINIRSIHHTRQDFAMFVDADPLRAEIEWNGVLFNTLHGATALTPTDGVRRVFFADPAALSSTPPTSTDWPVSWTLTAVGATDQMNVSAVVRQPKGINDTRTIVEDEDYNTTTHKLRKLISTITLVNGIVTNWPSGTWTDVDQAVLCRAP